jgi:hypothetical protein
MGRSKALVLAARPPFEGPWVPIGEKERWVCKVSCRPAAELKGQVEILVKDQHGAVHHLFPDGDIMGVQAKARCKEMNGNLSVTITLEEPEE